MKTCESCYREHNGRGRFCAQCNNPGRVSERKRAGERMNGSQLASHLELADQAARADETGWPFEDDDDRE